MDNPVLEAARAKREAQQEKLDAIPALALTEERELTDDEMADFEKRAAKIVNLDKQIELLAAEDARKEAALAAAEKPAPINPLDGIRSEPQVYTPQSAPGESYLTDLVALTVPQAGWADKVEGARARMERHLKVVEVEARTDPKVAEMWRSARYEMRTNPNTTAGTGGEFVPPLWLVGSYVPFFRPGRVCANRVQNRPLPPGIDVINIPLITTGSSTAIQTANAAAVSSTDIVTTSASANVNTIAGQEDISLQLLEQSPIAMDGVVFEDLAADYDQRLDLQVISGTGANGQHKGVQVVTQSATPGITTAFYSSSTSATFYGTAAGNVPAIIQGVNNIETIRFAAPTAVWVHPRRANWWLAGGGSSGAADTTHRPLFLSGPMFNAVGQSSDAGAVTQGVCGSIFGLPVVKDANMSTTCLTGAPTGSTQDAAIVLKEDDMILWEGQLKMRALPEILSGTLQIRFQVYAYSAFMATRAPAAIAVAGGTGFAAPTF